jgi:hypothetical protein
MKKILLVSLLSGFVLGVRAQPAAVQQFQNFQLTQPNQLDQALRVGTNAPELYRGENEDIGPQRILRLNPRAKLFDVTLDTQVFYTDNANFAERPNDIGSYVFVNTAQAAFTPEPIAFGPGKFAPAIGFASQWYNYDDQRMQPFDFDAQTAFANAKYTVDKWQFGLGASFTRILKQSNYDETYREILPTLGVQRVFPLGDTLLLVIGDQVGYHFSREPLLPGSRTDINDRFDNAINVSLNWQLAQKITVQPFYRLQYSYYQNNTLQTADRNDWLHNVGFTVAWYLTPHLTLRTFFSYNLKQTDDVVSPKFRELNGGLGLSFDWKF